MAKEKNLFTMRPICKSSFFLPRYRLSGRVGRYF